MVKILGVAIGVACCVAVITAFPMYGPKTLPIFPQPRNLGKGKFESPHTPILKQKLTFLTREYFYWCSNFFVTF